MPRQVAHALLTRPPLSLLRSIRRLPSANSVRLECVMHAASVHPEPGSNSRIICINSSLSRCNYHSSFFSSFFYFCLSSILYKEFLTRSLSHYTFFALYFFNLLLFNFQWPISLSSKIYSFVIISQTISLCQVLFSLFLKLFSLGSPLSSRLDYITILLGVCQYLF